MAKRKHDQNERRELIRNVAEIALWIVGMIVVSVALLACAGVVTVLSAFGQGCLAVSHCSPTPSPTTFHTSLPPNLAPQAEALLANPAPLPDFLYGVQPVTDDGDTKAICVLVDRTRLLSVTQHFVINGTLFTNVDYRIANNETTAQKALEMCAHAPLDAGLHLIEFTTTLYNSDLYASYQWAVEIEP